MLGCHIEVSKSSIFLIGFMMINPLRVWVLLRKSLVSPYVTTLNPKPKTTQNNSKLKPQNPKP